MGWKGTLRAIEAESRRAERESRGRQRELEKQRKQLGKMQELERAKYEVEEYANYVDVLTSIHKECSDAWNWEEISSSTPPSKPTKTESHEQAAQARLNAYKPGFVDKLLGHVESKREQLRRAVDEAKTKDEMKYQDALTEYNQDYEEWQMIRDLAGRILAKETEVFLEAISQIDPFDEITALGSSIECRVANGSLIMATLKVNGEEVVPAEAKSLLKTGKLSVKKMPTSAFNELYQDYVCGCVLRVARELFALLPIDMTVITAAGELLNSQTGHLEECPILSVAIPRQTLAKLNFETLDPSDSMKNFVHNMDFQKTKGFSAVPTIDPSQLD